MSGFDNINSITSFNELNNPKINENKDYIILFFYYSGCGACHIAIPTICDIFNSLPKSYNSKIIKVHSTDINDENLKEIYTGGVPAFRILKKINDKYELCKLKNKNYNYSIDGFADNNYINKNNQKWLSTKNTLIEWILFLNNKNNENIQLILPEIKLQQVEKNDENFKIYKNDTDDRSGYSKLNEIYKQIYKHIYKQIYKPKNKSFNRIINEHTNFNKYYSF